jgi:hypothetical protein
VLLGTPLQASLSPHLLNVPVQIANKHGLQKKKMKRVVKSAQVSIYLFSYPKYGLKQEILFRHFIVEGLK